MILSIHFIDKELNLIELYFIFKLDLKIGEKQEGITGSKNGDLTVSFGGQGRACNPWVFFLA